MTDPPAPSPDGSPRASAAPEPAAPWGSSVLYAAARMYYSEDATQAEIATRMGISRATVSRVLSEARRRGIVKITVIEPAPDADDELRRAVERELALDRVFIATSTGTASPLADDQLGPSLGPAVGRALTEAGLVHGDAVVVSSGRTLYEVARSRLPQLPGVLVAPAVGGIDQPEDWFQTNEITRLLAAATGGRALYLFAPALPGPGLYATLRRDPTIQRVLGLWSQATLVLTGVGAAPLIRAQVPQYVPTSADSLRRAVGDVCGRFFDRDGRPVEFEGSDRLIALGLDDLRRLPAVVGVATGPTKVQPIIAAARAGYLDQLVTDQSTAEESLARV